MKFFVIFTVVFTLQVSKRSCETGNEKQAPNIDIATIVKHILERLDRMEKKIDKNTDTTNRLGNTVNVVEKTVRSNMDILLRIGNHVQKQEIKIDEVMKKTESEDKKISENEENVKAHAQSINQLISQNKKVSQIIKEIVKNDKTANGKINENTRAVKTIGIQNEKLSEILKDNLRNISHDVTEIKEKITNVLPGKSESTPAESCAWLKTHSYCARDGYYWTKEEDRVTKKYCMMDIEGPVTTAVPTSAHSTDQPITRTSTTTRRITRPPTRSPILHGSSCKDLKDRYPELKSGTYTITVGGKSFEVVCDMETDEGGWTMIGSAIVTKNSHADHFTYDRIQSDDYTLLKRVITGKYVLSMNGINALYDASPFHEIRFDCRKKHHKRRVNLRTMGEHAVLWLLRRRSYSDRPGSCGTFTPLENDTSIIGHNCKYWYSKTWFSQHLYEDTIRAFDTNSYYVSLYYDGYSQLYCDDYKDDADFDNVGSWFYYIR